MGYRTGRWIVPGHISWFVWWSLEIHVYISLGPQGQSKTRTWSVTSIWVWTFIKMINQMFAMSIYKLGNVILNVNIDMWYMCLALWKHHWRALRWSSWPRVGHRRSILRASKLLKLLVTCDLGHSLLAGGYYLGRSPGFDGFPVQISVYMSLGPQNLSRKLNWVCDMVTGNVRNGKTNASTNPRIFSKRVSKVLRRLRRSS